MSVQYREFARPSLSGEGDLFCRSWTPDDPRAIVEIAHGMCEHSGRYGRLGELLARNGWAVYMNDHCGHGRSTMGHPGTFVLGRHGFDFVLGDMRTLLDYAAQEYPGKRKVLIGHSMGSILAGICGDRWGKELAGLVLLSTPSPNRYVGLYSAIAGCIARRKGPAFQSELLHRISSGATSGSRKLPPLVRKRWLSHNMENITAYLHDPLAGFDFSASATAELADGLQEFGGRHWGERMPKRLPVLIMAGGEDRGGGYGEASRHYRDQLVEKGVRDVTLHIIPGARHEIFNELDTHEADETLLRWLDSRL